MYICEILLPLSDLFYQTRLVSHPHAFPYLKTWIHDQNPVYDEIKFVSFTEKILQLYHLREAAFYQFHTK